MWNAPDGPRNSHHWTASYSSVQRPSDSCSIPTCTQKVISKFAPMCNMSLHRRTTGKTWARLCKLQEAQMGLGPDDVHLTLHRHLGVTRCAHQQQVGTQNPKMLERVFQAINAHPCFTGESPQAVQSSIKLREPKLCCSNFTSPGTSPLKPN